MLPYIKSDVSTLYSPPYQKPQEDGCFGNAYGEFKTADFESKTRRRKF
jgi:hypothetical protein